MLFGTGFAPLKATPVEVIRKPRTVSRKVVVAAVSIAAVGIGVAVISHDRSVTLHGALIRKSDDPSAETPLSDVQVTATDGSLIVHTKSNSAGAFAVTVRRSVIRRHPLELDFRRRGYEPAHIFDPVGDRLYVVNMVPVPEATPVSPEHPSVKIGNVSIRYTLKTEATVDVGSGVKTFQVVNMGNVPCKKRRPCSPDGKWKASLGSASIDAGPEIEFRDGRVSCIAGPCPFTKIQKDDFSHGGRIIGVTILNWSDTATFLLQAEAVRHVRNDNTRTSYPVSFGRTISFSLPSSAEGTCIEAEVDGTPIVFPIVPNLSTGWADCVAQKEPDNNTLFRCELRPGYSFR